MAKTGGSYHYYKVLFSGTYRRKNLYLNALIEGWGVGELESSE